MFVEENIILEKNEKIIKTVLHTIEIFFEIQVEFNLRRKKQRMQKMHTLIFIIEGNQGIMRKYAKNAYF